MTAMVLSLVIAASPISLEEVRHLSRQFNNAAQLANLDKLIADQQLRAARSAIFPQLGVDARVSRNLQSPKTDIVTTVNRDPNNTIVPVGEAYTAAFPSPAQRNGLLDLSATLSQLIYDGGRWWNQIAQAGAQEEAAVGKAAEQQNVSEYEGVRRFYELYRAQKSLEVLEATVKRSEEQLGRASAMYEAGRLAKGDVYAAEVNLGNDQISVLRQRTQIANAQADLAIWIARPGTEDLAANEPAAVVGDPLPPIVQDKAVSVARDNRPLLKSLQQQARAASLAIDVARSGYLPKLSGFVTAGRRAPNADIWAGSLPRQNYLNLGLTLHWDVFTGFLTDAQTTQARYQKSEADLNFAEAARGVEGDIHRGLVTLASQIESTRVATKNRQAAAQGLVFAEERFKAGAGNTLEVRDAQLKLTQAELNRLSSRIDVEIARARIIQVMGTESTGANP